MYYCTVKCVQFVVMSLKRKLVTLTIAEKVNIISEGETGSFYKCLPYQAFVLKGVNCAGGKNSKERVTILLGSNMTGIRDLNKLLCF